ncbi:MAG TPA: hypothetical protein VGH80_15130 [Xanthomonadaceae bacterium]|jgi:ElaB/YqjD/DUF883 family membrane-anchored ribosome-binding protein
MSIPEESEASIPTPLPTSRLRNAAEHLGQAREHLSTGVSQARVDLATGISEARADLATGVGDAREHLSAGVSEAMGSSKDAAREAKAELDDKLEKLLDQGKDMIGQAEDLIRSRPWTSFGAAFAAGFLLAKLTRRN